MTAQERKPNDDALFIAPGKRHSYLGVYSGDGQYKIVELDAETEGARSYHVSSAQMTAVLSTPEAERYAAAADLFHQARTAKKARRTSRETGGHDAELVPASTGDDGKPRV